MTTKPPTVGPRGGAGDSGADKQEHVPACTGCQILGLLAEVERLKAIIAEAPHGRGCINLTPAYYFAKPACNCWKSEATA